MKVCMFEFFFLFTYREREGGSLVLVGIFFFSSSSFCFVLLCFVTGNTFVHTIFIFLCNVTFCF